MGILPGGRKLRTLVDCVIYYVVIRVCEVVSLKQVYIPLVGLSGRYVDADEQGSSGFYVEILVFI